MTSNGSDFLPDQLLLIEPSRADPGFLEGVHMYKCVCVGGPLDDFIFS